MNLLAEEIVRHSQVVRTLATSECCVIVLVYKPSIQKVILIK